MTSPFPDSHSGFESGYSAQGAHGDLDEDNIDSDRKQVEEALRQSEAKYRRIVETANEGIWVTDLEMVTTYVNQKMADMLGYHPEDMLGRSSLEFVFERDRTAAIERFNQRKQGVCEQLDFVLRHRDGSPVWIRTNTSFILDDQEQRIGILSMISDITERKQAEEALQRYQLLSEHSRDIVLYISRDGQILEANQAAVQAYGYDRTELLTLKIADLRAPDTFNSLTQQFAQADQQGILFETWHRRKDGSAFPVEVSAQSAAIDTGGGVLSIIRDITQRKEAEFEREQLLQREKAARETAEAAERWARFLAEVSTTLASSLDYESTLRSVAQAVVPTLADWCAVDILEEDGTLGRLATAHIDPAKVQWGLELHRRYPPNLDAPRGLAQVLRSGEAECYPTILDEQLAASARDPEHLRMLREVGLHSVMLVPLNARGRTLGVITFILAESQRSYGSEDLTLAEELARRAAIALDNARLYQAAQAARQTAERAADRMARLQAVTAALSESLTPVQVAEVIVQQSLAALGADAALMALLSEEGKALEIVQSVGYDTTPEAALKHLPLDAPMPLVETVRTGQPIWSEPLTERLSRYPNLAEIYKRLPFEAWISLPLMAEGKAVGGLSLSFKTFKHLNQDDRDFMLALTQQCAQAIVRAQLYEAEQRARTEAERANRLKDEFLAILSHELRSPLNPILGWSRLLQTQKFDSATAARAMATIERNARLQAQLIEDLLDMSRILRGKLTLSIAAVNLEATLYAALETVQLAAEAKSLQVRTQVVSSIPPILGDANRLQQVIWNLLSNAVKFTPAGGEIDIKLERLEFPFQVQQNRVTLDPELAELSQTPQGYIQITVKDTGSGISPEFLPHVFESFRQAEGGTTRQFGGLGLGLAIVRQLVEAHGGSITAESPGKDLGATFTVRLPLLDAEPAAELIDKLPLERLDLSGIQILTVDDDLDARELLTVLLTQHGAEVLTVTSATEALSALQSFQPDLLISDIGMPEMNGYSLLQQIRALPPEKGGQIPAIALTAYAGWEDQQQALAHGFQQHVAKPIDANQLIQAVWVLANPRVVGYSRLK